MKLSRRKFFAGVSASLAAALCVPVFGSSRFVVGLDFSEREWNAVTIIPLKNLYGWGNVTWHRWRFVEGEAR